MRGKLTGFASFIAKMLKPAGRIDSHGFTLWSRNRIVFCALPLEKRAERDQRRCGRRGRQAYSCRSRKVTFDFPLKHLQQLINPASFNPWRVKRENRMNQINLHPSRQSRLSRATILWISSVLKESGAVLPAPESVPH